jgi:hypothetical protein
MSLGQDNEELMSAALFVLTFHALVGVITNKPPVPGIQTEPSGSVARRSIEFSH